jgi:hypothetical protein
MTNTINSQRLLSGSAHRSSGMIWKRTVGLAALLILLSLFASAQTDNATEPEGKSLGGYNVRQSIEFGGRFTSGFGGNLSMYNSLVNLQSGPRLLDQSLAMRSENHTGLFFDTLTESMTGFGGDPNQIGRFRMSKNKLYDFSVQYRHDQYYSDYNLLGNEIAVPNPNPLNVNVFNRSPHFMDTRRSMTDFDLKLLPQSWMSFRVGYSHGRDQGPAYLTQHSPGDVAYVQNFSTRTDRYRVGVDVKPFARTQFSYDFFYEHDRNDTAALNDVNNLYSLGGILIDPGFMYDPNPSTKVPNCTFTAGTPITVNSTCSGFISYARTQPVKTDLPTHQFSFFSNYFRKLDLSGSASYTSGTSKIDSYSELYSRFSSPTYSQNGIFGGVSNRELTGNADFKATIHFNNTWSFDEKFRWVNWRVPGTGSFTNTLTTNLTAGTISTPAALPLASTMTIYSNILGENSKYNTLQLNWNPSSMFGARIGYKLGLRDIRDNAQSSTLTLGTGVTALGAPAPGLDSETEHHALLGFTARPVKQWRVNVDGDLMSSNGIYTAISPRHAQTIKTNSSYQIAEWGTIAGSMVIAARRNDGDAIFPAAFAAADKQYRSHTRTYDLNFNLHPTRKIDVDLGWSYEDINEHAPLCVPLNASTATGQATYGFGTNTCLYTGGGLRANVYPLLSNYLESTNTGYLMVVLKPMNRVTLNLGYDVTSNSGNQTWLRADDGTVFLMPVDATGNAVLNSTQVATGTYAGLYPWLPLGSLSYNWHRPVVGVSIDLAKGLTFKGGYNNYDYNEKGTQVTPVLPRDFHGNVMTLSLKHSF